MPEVISSWGQILNQGDYIYDIILIVYDYSLIDSLLYIAMSYLMFWETFTKIKSDD